MARTLTRELENTSPAARSARYLREFRLRRCERPVGWGITACGGNETHAARRELAYTRNIVREVQGADAQDREENVHLVATIPKAEYTRLFGFASD